MGSEGFRRGRDTVCAGRTTLDRAKALSGQREFMIGRSAKEEAKSIGEAPFSSFELGKIALTGLRLSKIG